MNVLPMLDNQYYHRYIGRTLDQYLLPMLQCSANITILGQCLYNVDLLPEIFEKISVSKIRKTSQVPPLEKFSKKIQSRKFEKPHRSLPWRYFRKNFSLKNSKNLTGPSLGEIFEKISVSKIRKTSLVPPLEKFSKKFQSRKFEKPHRSLHWRIFRKNFSLENSKNLTGPSIGEIFEKISVSKIRKI